MLTFFAAFTIQAADTAATARPMSGIGAGVVPSACPANGWGYANDGKTRPGEKRN